MRRRRAGARRRSRGGPVPRQRPRGQTRADHHRGRDDGPRNTRRRQARDTEDRQGLRNAHGVGGRAAAAARPRERRHPHRRQAGARVRRGRCRVMPHRAHVLRGRSHHADARNDRGPRRSGPPSRPGEAATDSTARFRRHFRSDGRAPRDDPAARSAAPRVSAAYARGDRSTCQAPENPGGPAGAPRAFAGRSESDAGAPRLPTGHYASGDHRDAGARHLRGGVSRRRPRVEGVGRDHGATGGGRA